MCTKCLDGEFCNTNLCTVQVFETNNDFCNWLFSDINSNNTAIAHNAQGFDGIFLMKFIINTMTSKDSMPSIIMKGIKILTLSYRKVKLIDSFSFIPMALDKLPKTFGIKELKKGFFPHLFNKPINYGYVGHIPDKKFFSPEFFSESKKQEFDLWYTSQLLVEYNFKFELISYCKSDVIERKYTSL